MGVTTDKLLGKQLLHSHTASDISDADSRYVNASGDTMTGNLTLNGTNPTQVITGTDKDLSLMPNGIGNVGINTLDPDEKLTVNGNFSVRDADTPTKGYRFRTSGSDLDVDGSGKKMWFSVYSSAGYTGTQRFYFALNNSSTDADAFGNWRFQSAPFGTNRLTVLSSTRLTVNEGLADYDFRVSGDTDTNNLYSDASTDRIGIGTDTPTAKLDINSNVIRLRTAKTPASATDTGNAGDICWDANYIYVCTATNTWKRVAIATW